MVQRTRDYPGAGAQPVSREVYSGAMTRRVGKFELRRVLGKGASGTVYLALDTFSGQDVALKVLTPEVVAAQDFDRTHTRQFMNEASLVGRISHPHIASILEAAVDEQSGGYIAIEYVSGGDLSQFTESGHTLAAEEAIEIAFKCCGALDYAFRQGLVHRDIKPANIMVASGTNIKVVDFGAACLLKAQDPESALIGSPFYMSPEQITRQPLTYHSDMFALGVVLYELFTGKRPFAGASVLELFDAIRNKDPVAPSILRPGTSKEVDAILARMLAKSVGDRYPTWADLALDLADAGRLKASQQTISDREKYVALRKNAVLERLDDAEIWEMVHAGRWTRVPAGAVIVAEGELGSSLFFLGSGSAKVLKQGRLLNVLQTGEYFGEMAYIKAGAMPRQATAVAATDVVLAEFEPAALQQVSKNCQLQLTTALLHSLVDRLALTNERLARVMT
jgi:eukaryotic-like serine/threonine-protein kinase